MIRPRKSARTQILQLAGITVLVIGAIWLALEPLSVAIAHRVPFAWERKAGDQLGDAFLKKSCHSPGGDAAVARLLSRLRGEQSFVVDFDVHVVHESEVNAFALPGGHILINDGLLQKAEDPDEVAGVLAHEMQHVIHRHVTAGLVRSAVLTMLWQVTFGDFSGALAVDPSTAYQLATLKFNRAAESEADRGALVLLEGAHVSRKGFARFFERLKANEPHGLSLLSTHPASEEREKLAEKGAGDEGAVTPALGDEDWRELRSMCGEGRELPAGEGEEKERA